MEWLHEHARDLRGPSAFCPPLWLRPGHLQTLAASQARREFPDERAGEWETVTLSGGCMVRILRFGSDPQAPTAILLHGMGGSTDSGYMKGLMGKARGQGWNAVGVNLYNVNPDLDPPRILHAGSSVQVAETFDRAGLLQGRILLIGVSLGGNLLLKLLGEWGADFPPAIKAAATLSPLVDLKVSWPLLDRRANWLYRQHFVRRLRGLAHDSSQRLRAVVDLEALKTVSTIRGFDELVTAPLGGFRNVDHYYTEASARPLLGQVRVPTLIIHAADDPLLPSEPWSDRAVTGNPRLGLALQPRGGHVGFFQRRRAHDVDRWWAENRIVDYLSLALAKG